MFRKKDTSPENTTPETVEAETEETVAAEVQEDTCEAPEETVEEVNPLEEELAQAKENYLRLAAEYDNFRKRTQREKEAITADVKASTVEKLLPIMDNIDLALGYDGADENTILKGVEMIKQQTLTIFEGLGIVPFCEPGDAFDPNVHNCISMVASEEFESGQITLVIQKGYKLGEKVVRPAMVQVAE